MGEISEIAAVLPAQETPTQERVLLYDAYGRLVALVYNGELPAEQSSFQIDTMNVVATIDPPIL